MILVKRFLAGATGVMRASQSHLKRYRLEARPSQSHPANHTQLITPANHTQPKLHVSPFSLRQIQTCLFIRAQRVRQRCGALGSNVVVVGVQSSWSAAGEVEGILQRDLATTARKTLWIFQGGMNTVHAVAFPRTARSLLSGAFSLCTDLGCS